MSFHPSPESNLWIRQVQWAGQPALFMRAPDGACVTVLLQGAHVVSWTGSDGQEQLFLSERAVYAPGQAVRGGIPVIFPQFECRGPLPRHGFARTTQWHKGLARCSATDALLVMEFSDDEATQAIWPHVFVAELTIRFSNTRLDIELAVKNTGLAAFRFTAALHTYLLVSDVGRVALEGLHRLRYLDSTRNVEQVETHQVLQIDGEIDRIYFDAARELHLHDLGVSRRIAVSGFHDVVIWNPGAEKCLSMPDMLPEGFKQMLCVEAAAVGRPVDLPAGEQWVGRQSIERLV